MSSQQGSDLEFYAKRLKTQMERSQCESYQAFVPVSVFEEIIHHLSRRLDSFEQRMYQIESSSVYNEDILKLIRDEYKQFSSIYKSSMAEMSTEIEIHSKHIKQLQKSTHENTQFLNTFQNTFVNKDDMSKALRLANQQIDSINSELQTQISSSYKMNQSIVLKTKEIELFLDNLQNMNIPKNNIFQSDGDQGGINSSVQSALTSIKIESAAKISSLQVTLEEELEIIKSHLIKVIDLVIQQQSD